MEVNDEKTKYIIIISIVVAVCIAGYLVYTFSDRNEYMAESENGYWRAAVFTLSTDEDYKYGSDLALIYQGSKDGKIGKNVNVKWWSDENAVNEEHDIGSDEPGERQNIKYYLWNTINRKFYYTLSEGGIDPDKDRKITVKIEWTENGEKKQDTVYLEL